MVPLDYALAVALLSAAPDAEVPARVAEQLATVLPTVHAVAVSWELLDPREVRDLAARHNAFTDNLQLLRERRRDLADAPPLHDCQRFPDRNLVNDLLSFNRTYRQQLAARQTLEVAYYWELRAAVEETDRLYRIWDLARDARTDYYYINVRREALKKLRETVGSQAYYNGCLPPHVPVWNFTCMD
jgi:hypothetical protein